MLTIKHRALVSAGVAFCVVLVLMLWPMPGLKEIAPPAPVSVLANTWFGPALLLVIPALALWTSFGAETHSDVSLGVGISFALMLVCLLVIWYANQLFRAYYGPY
jgi:hypothetical protein